MTATKGDYKWSDKENIRVSGILCHGVQTESFYRKIKNDSKLEKMGKKGNSPIYEPNRKGSWEETNHF